MKPGRLKRQSTAKRSGRLARQSKKMRQAKDVEHAWATATRPRCFVCLAQTTSTRYVSLEPHHLCPGSGKANGDEAALTLLCLLCHRVYHETCQDGPGVVLDGFKFPPLTPGNLLWAKRMETPDEYDEAAILKMLGRKELPEAWQPQEPGAWWMEERIRNGGPYENQTA